MALPFHEDQQETAESYFRFQRQSNVTPLSFQAMVAYCTSYFVVKNEWHPPILFSLSGPPTRYSDHRNSHSFAFEKVQKDYGYTQLSKNLVSLPLMDNLRSWLARDLMFV